MAQVTVYSMAKEKVGSVELSDAVFGQRPRLPLLFEAVQHQLTNRRQGNASTKVRSEVRGGGKKPYRQKGTGRARHGSTRSPIFVGGGTTFGPRPRDFTAQMPRRARRAALRSALSVKQAEGKVVVIDQWRFDRPQTKPAAQALKGLGVHSGLVVLEVANENVQRSMRNIPNIKVIPELLLNPYDLLRYDHVVFTKAALKKFDARLRSEGQGQ